MAFVRSINWSIRSIKRQREAFGQTVFWSEAISSLFISWPNKRSLRIPFLGSFGISLQPHLRADCLCRRSGLSETLGISECWQGGLVLLSWRTGEFLGFDGTTADSLLRLRGVSDPRVQKHLRSEFHTWANHKTQLYSQNYFIYLLHSHDCFSPFCVWACWAQLPISHVGTKAIALREGGSFMLLNEDRPVLPWFLS